MTKVFENQYFSDFDDRDSGAVFDGYEFRKCEFGSVGVSITPDPALRSTIRNCKFIKSKIVGSPAIWGAVIEDTLIDTASSRRPPWIVRGVVFNRVVLRGPIPPIAVVNATGFFEDSVQEAYDVANEEFYKTVDWALDISEAEFTGEAEFQSVPGRLIVRNPSTQVLVTMEAAQSFPWDQIDFGDTGWDIGLSELESGQIESQIFAAAKRGKRFSEEMRVIDQMKRMGLCEPGSVGLVCDANGPRFHFDPQRVSKT